MTYLEELCAELKRVGIDGALAARILDELADHLECDPDAALGAPRLVAERFADELGLARTRRAAKLAFAGLALAGVLLVGTSARSSYPQSPQNATAVALTGLAIVAFGQIAFVAGTLAFVRAMRRSLSSADRRLVQRRAAVALASGALTCIALVVHGIVFRPMPSSWIALTIAAGAVPMPVLAYAGARIGAAARLTPAGGSAAGLSGDLPGALGRHARAVLVALGAAAVALVVVQGSAFERHASEGPVRGAIELVGLAVGAAVFGRVLGLFT